MTSKDLLKTLIIHKVLHTIFGKYLVGSLCLGDTLSELLLDQQLAAGCRWLALSQVIASQEVIL